MGRHRHPLPSVTAGAAVTPAPGTAGRSGVAATAAPTGPVVTVPSTPSTPRPDGDVTRTGPMLEVQPDPAAAAADRRFVTALARGLDLLRCFRPQDRWLPHQELARRTGLPQATVSRLSFTLVQLGYLRHRPGRGEYALGPGVIALGYSMLSQFDLARLARPHMQALAEAAQAAVSMGQRHDLQMVYVAHCRSHARLTLGLDVGTRLPLLQTAMGRTLLCALPEAQRAPLFARLAALDPDGWPRAREALQRAQAQWARDGFVIAQSEWSPEISAVGVALDLGDGREPSVITIGGAASHLTRERLQHEHGPRLREAVAALRAQVQSGAGRD
jgi:DNA-binding IclR family transcriptional regulator